MLNPISAFRPLSGRFLRVVPRDGKGGPLACALPPFSLFPCPIVYLGCSKLFIYIYITPLVFSFPPDPDDTDSRLLDVMKR